MSDPDDYEDDFETYDDDFEVSPSPDKLISHAHH